MEYPNVLKNLLEQLQKLPGIGIKTAERLTFYLLKSSPEEALKLAEAIQKVKHEIQQCKECFHITEKNPCVICANPKRNHSVICVVEQPKDLWAIEKTGCYNGVYHVLLGRIAPLEGEHMEQLTLQALKDRIQKSLAGDAPIKEVIIATNPNMEGDTTSLCLLNILKSFPINISKIARGISAGSSIEFANEAILTEAIMERKTIYEKKT